MSLALVQGYSSEEEVQERFSDSESEGTTGDEGSPVLLQDETTEGPSAAAAAPPLAPPFPADVSSSLPSAALVFSEVTGPPEYLKDSVGDVVTILPRARPQRFSQGSKVHQNLRTQKESPAGVVVEAKPQLVGLHERVRSDQGNTKAEPRKLPTAGLPPAEDAAKLLGVCLQCGVPKTYSAAKEGLVCPVCKDRPALDNDADSKKRGSKIKEKERSKRMKGQSSHATWKSETEMHLRQQFD